VTGKRWAVALSLTVVSVNGVSFTVWDGSGADRTIHKTVVSRTTVIERRIVVRELPGRRTRSRTTVAADRKGYASAPTRVTLRPESDRPTQTPSSPSVPRPKRMVADVRSDVESSVASGPGQADAHKDVSAAITTTVTQVAVHTSGSTSASATGSGSSAVAEASGGAFIVVEGG
jgi:hypothetical protein